MKPGTALGASVASLALVILCHSLPPLSSHRPKSRPMRCQAVNTIRTVSMVLTDTNAPATTEPNARE